MLEKDIEAAMGKALKAQGCMWLKFVSPGCAAVPDRICITAEGRVVFVELKTITGRLTPLQEQMIKELRKHHAEVEVVYGMERAMAFVESVAPAHAQQGGGAK